MNKETLQKCADEQVIPGKLTFTGGIMMKEYKYTPETFPDPVVGKGYYIFPVIQYFGGKGEVVWPEDVKTTDLKIPPGTK